MAIKANLSRNPQIKYIELPPMLVRLIWCMKKNGWAYVRSWSNEVGWRDIASFLDRSLGGWLMTMLCWYCSKGSNRLIQFVTGST